MAYRGGATGYPCSGGTALLPDARLPRPRLRPIRCKLERPARPYTLVMADEDIVLDEAMDNLKEAGQRIRATQSLMRSEGMTDDSDYRELTLCLRTSLAMVEAAYMEARRRGLVADVSLRRGRGYEAALSVAKSV
jgi:hypothetical protein